MNMTQNSSVKVVVIRSLSYTGTTWLNLLLGCHENAFAMGTLRHFATLHSSNPERICAIHGDKCSFWPGFCRKYDPNRNFYLQLAEYSGKGAIIINNPIPEYAQQLGHPAIDQKNVYVTRDGRAVSASYSRKNPGMGYTRSLAQWYAPSIHKFVARLDFDNDLVVKYEDALKDCGRFISSLGRSVGIEYGDNVHNYWEYPHHMAGGNTGAIMLLRRHYGLEGFPSFESYEHYSSQLNREKQGERFTDDRWKDQLNRKDRFIFDCLCGEANGAMGYERDTFSEREKSLWESEAAALAEERLESSNKGQVY